MNKYIIVNAEALQKRIDELESKKGSDECSDPRDYSYLTGKIHQLEQVLLFSTPLIPEIEKAFDAGQFEEYKEISFDGGENYETVRIIKEKQDYISNLKIDI